MASRPNNTSILQIIPAKGKRRRCGGVARRLPGGPEDPKGAGDDRSPQCGMAPGRVLEPVEAHAALVLDLHWIKTNLARYKSLPIVSGVQGVAPVVMSALAEER